jgi:hypothetical protein
VHLRIYDTGEPSAVNVACSVREGAVGKGPALRAPRWRPTSPCGGFGKGPTEKDPYCGHLTGGLLHSEEAVDAAMRPPLSDDHGRLKARLRPMRGLKRLCSARVISTGRAFVQNLRRGHYELGWDIDRRHRLPAIFAELTRAI